MKKYFFPCFATIAFAAITTSATYSNFGSQNLPRVNVVYDTTPGGNRSDSSGNWDKNNNKNDSKNYDSTGNMDKKDSSGSRPPHK